EGGQRVGGVAGVGLVVEDQGGRDEDAVDCHNTLDRVQDRGGLADGDGVVAGSPPNVQGPGGRGSRAVNRIVAGAGVQGGEVSPGVEHVVRIGAVAAVDRYEADRAEVDGVPRPGHRRGGQRVGGVGGVGLVVDNQVGKEADAVDRHSALDRVQVV